MPSLRFLDETKVLPACSWMIFRFKIILLANSARLYCPILRGTARGDTGIPSIKLVNTFSCLASKADSSDI